MSKPSALQHGCSVTYRRWSFTRGSNCKPLNGKILVFWIQSLMGRGCLWEVITHGGSIEIFFWGCKLNSPYNSNHLGTEKMLPLSHCHLTDKNVILILYKKLGNIKSSAMHCSLVRGRSEHVFSWKLLLEPVPSEGLFFVVLGTNIVHRTENKICRTTTCSIFTSFSHFQQHQLQK